MTATGSEVIDEVEVIGMVETIMILVLVDTDMTPPVE